MFEKILTHLIVWVCITTGLAFAQVNEPSAGRVRVVLCEDTSLVSRFEVDEKRLMAAWDKSLLTLTQTQSTKQAWQGLISPKDVVGIHLGGTGHPLSMPPKSLLQHLIEQIKAVGVLPKNIFVWGRDQDRLIASGYDPQSASFPLLTVWPPGSGFDAQVFYFNEVAGKLIWGDFEFKPLKPTQLLEDKEENKDALNSQISNRSYFTKLVTQRATKIINIVPMMDHADLGVYGACASLAMESVDNNRRFFAEGVRGDPSIGEILKHDAFKNKTVLHAMVGMVAQYAGGPEFKPYYTVPAGWLSVSHDPVALDALALRQMEQWRVENKIVPIGENARHIATAARLGAGVNEMSRMDIVRVKDGF